MLFYVLPQLANMSPFLGALNVTRYITFRTAAASLTAFAISMLFGPWLIRTLRDFQIGQIIRQDGIRRAQDQRSLQRILEFAHVARPVIVHQTSQRLRRQRFNPHVAFAAGLGHEIICQQRYIFSPLAQRWHGETHHVEPVIQVVAERTRLDRFRQASISGRNQADVELYGPGSAQTLELAFL